MFYCLIFFNISIKVKYICVSPIFIHKQDVGLKRALEK